MDNMRAEDKRAPMASAPMKYLPDGSVDWGNMWDTFCVLGKDGGPPHRETMLDAREECDADSDEYRFAVAEISRGIREVSGLEAAAASPGWISVRCGSPGMAHWLCEAIKQENVQARDEGVVLFVPVGASYTVKGEIKNVITAVAKTTHYWQEHVPPDIKLALRVEEWGRRLRTRLARGSRRAV